MELPINALRKLDAFVSKLDETDCILDRHIAIREAARLLICLTHEEYYNNTDAFDEKYSIIATTCRSFTEV